MSVMMIWTLDLDPVRVDEARRLVAERRIQVKRHSCRALRTYRVRADDTDVTNRVIAIEEFDSQNDLDSFMRTQPQDVDAQATIAKTFAPVGPFSVVDMCTVEDFEQFVAACHRRLGQSSMSLEPRQGGSALAITSLLLATNLIGHSVDEAYRARAATEVARPVPTTAKESP